MAPPLAPFAPDLPRLRVSEPCSSSGPSFPATAMVPPCEAPPPPPIDCATTPRAPEPWVEMTEFWSSATVTVLAYWPEPPSPPSPRVACIE